MKVKALLLVGLLACVAATLAPSIKGSSKASVPIAGDYVEARTAAVFAGACHYNGEYVTTGREAVMAWNFTSGTFNGVDLSGVRAAAALSADASLGDDQAARKSEIVVDSSATDQQAAAVVELIKSKCGASLGQLVSVRRTPISFAHSQDGYAVEVSGFAKLTVSPLPDNTCCTSPGLVWFSPLSPIQGRKVGYTDYASYSGTITSPWQRFGENDAFYGPIAF